MLVLFFPDWLEKIAVWPIYAMKSCARELARGIILFQTAHYDETVLLDLLRYRHFLFSII